MMPVIKISRRKPVIGLNNTRCNRVEFSVAGLNSKIDLINVSPPSFAIDDMKIS
jgi:hypothetical protein